MVDSGRSSFSTDPLQFGHVTRLDSPVIRAFDRTMTKGEIQAVLFVAVSLLVGAFVLLVKKYNADFLPDLGPATAERPGNVDARTERSTTSGYSAAMTHAPAAGKPSTVNNTESGDRLVAINTAPAAELQKLPGIGPVLAERIIAHRNKSGDFATVDQLMDVKGIGPAKLDRMRPFVKLR